ncbi:glycerol-3-phosphate dehydrogenase/oxidase [Chitinibacter sp. S2-10]|uniref:glycerol-3-phosphate dehydrogenase/oxidase n=1 Tax=Chitinibacter sp. S2-10 TaxID=3373597 RepID=UPI0039775662
MKYDLIIIGAGIQGAGVAQAAAAAGYSVLLLEQTAAAAGTSSKSSKLIHGGLRYLESAQFGLVRECLQERALLLKLAPDLVKLQTLHIPVYEQASRSPLTIRAGLSLYALLAGCNQNALFSQLAKSTWRDLTGLKQENLKAVFRYQEAQTDDAALTRAVLNSAQSLGAEVCIPAKFINASRSPTACEVNYTIMGRQESATCSVLVNCAGPWAHEVLAKISPTMTLPEVELIQGSHLLLPPLITQYFYVEAPQDQRAVFILPWQNQLLVGTTERTYHGAPAQTQCSDDERDYLLNVIRHYFPLLEIPTSQVRSFAGLRVLPRSNQNAFSRPRDVIFDLDHNTSPRVLSIMGGKLTTYRVTAQQAIARLKTSLPDRKSRADTRSLYLYPEI